MEKHLDHLKEKDVPGTDGETEPAGDRLNKLQQDAGALANTTQNMLQALDGNLTNISTKRKKFTQCILSSLGKVGHLVIKHKVLIVRLVRKFSYQQFS